MPATFTNLGAAITSLTVPGTDQEIALKYDNLSNYSHPLNRFFGASIGRYANRIYGSKVEVGGKEYQLAVTVPADKEKGIPDVTLHGGIKGFDKKEWKGPEKVARSDGKESLVYTYLSPHLDEGFPGELLVKAIYTSYTEGSAAILELEYEAQLTENSPVDETIVSLTNHNFFNVAPASSHTTTGTKVVVNSNKYIVHDPETTIPTGKVETFPDIPDSLQFTLEESKPAIDHCFVVQPPKEFKSLDTRNEPLVELVQMSHPESNIVLKVLSTEPVYQIYTTDKMDIPQLPGEPRAFGARAGVAVEPARPTNAVLNPEWKQWVSLKKGDTWGSKIVYKYELAK